MSSGPRIGPYVLPSRVVLAPMAGVTDRPFRQLCKKLGAGYAVSEMAASNPRLWASEKTARRIDHAGEMEPKAVQIAGADPQMLAECARFNVERGAQVGAGALVPPGKVVPAGWLVMGVPAKPVRQMSEEELADIRRNAASYLELWHRNFRGTGG